MTFRATRYDKHDAEPASSKWDKFIRRGKLELENHDSGCHYSMVAVMGKTTPISVGKNTLHFPANEVDFREIVVRYPEICGVHAELDLFRREHWRLKGKNVAILGVTTRNGNEMTNTKPCVYCHSMLRQAGVKSICYRMDGVYVTQRM